MEVNEPCEDESREKISIYSRWWTWLEIVYVMCVVKYQKFLRSRFHFMVLAWTKPLFVLCALLFHVGRHRQCVIWCIPIIRALVRIGRNLIPNNKRTPIKETRTSMANAGCFDLIVVWSKAGINTKHGLLCDAMGFCLLGFVNSGINTKSIAKADFGTRKRLSSFSSHSLDVLTKPRVVPTTLLLSFLICSCKYHSILFV